MKHLGVLVIIFMVCTIVNAQSRRIDKGNGHYKNLIVAATAIKLIEKGDVENLYKYFAPTLKIDSNYLKSNCDYVSTEFPYNDRQLPMSFNNNIGETLWYSRTYYKRDPKQIEYLFQIFIKLYKFNNEIKITHLEFRTKDKIENRDKEIESMNRKVDENNPPVAPPPPPTNE